MFAIIDLLFKETTLTTAHKQLIIQYFSLIVKC